MFSIALQNNQGFAVVDDDVAGWLCQFKWYLTSGGYARRNYTYCKKRQRVLMHREIMHPPDGIDIDHLNGDPLDNRRANLRLANRSLNIFNSRRVWGKSGVRGVHASGSKWRAVIYVDGLSTHVGSFPTKEEASVAYENARRDLMARQETRTASRLAVKSL